MKVKNFTGEVNLRYELKDSELEAAAADVTTIYQNSRKSNWPTEEIAKTPRSVRIYRDDKTGILKVGDIYHSVEIKTYKYIASVEYAIPLPLTQTLVDFELNHLKVADLSLGATYWGPWHTLFVKPAELEYLIQPWTCYKNWRVVEDETDITPFYTITISIPGTLKNQEQIRELESLCDKLCLPIYKGNDMWMSPDPNGGSTGGSIPEIKMLKKFGGEFSYEAEQKLKELYETVKEFVLRHKITEDFGIETKGCSWADTIRQAYRETEKVNAPSMAEYIASSTLQKQVMCYAPRTNIRVIIPVEKAYPKYTYQRQNQGKEKFGISQVVDMLEVIARPEYIEPELFVVNNYVWPGRK